MDAYKALLIINPISGTGNKAGLAEKVSTTLALRGVTVDVAYTKASGDATKIARRGVELGYGTVIAAGGDGTVNETAKALCDTGVNLGIIPCGSGNGLARHLNIPIDVKASIDIIADGHTEICDYGTVNGNKFFCTFGAGFDATVSHKFAQSKKRGLISYLRSTLQEFARYTPEEYIITANGQKITERAFIVAVCNASQYGNNAYIAPQASINDGLLDVTIIHYGNILSTALVGVDLMAGSINKNMLIHTFKAKDLVIERHSAGPVHIDGEPKEMPAVLDVECHRHSLRIFTPGQDKEIKPLLTPMRSMLSNIGYTIRAFFTK